MEKFWREVLWGQMGGAIDSLESAMILCPDHIWGDRSREPEFWYLVYHTLFFLDYYTSKSPDGFAPPEPFTLSEADPAGVLPERVYTKGELHTYLDHGREKCRAAIAAMTEETAREIRRFPSIEGPALEIHLSNMRHIQHHAAQLNLILRQKIDNAPRWVRRTNWKL